MAHDLPSARHLADLHGFYAGAKLNSDGTANLIFRVPRECKDRLLPISDNDGMALNISVWETRLPEGEEWLAAALGITVDLHDPPTGTVVVKKKRAEEPA